MASPYRFVIAHQAHTAKFRGKCAHAIVRAGGLLAVGHDVTFPAEGHVPKAFRQLQERQASRFIDGVDQRPTSIGDVASSVGGQCRRHDGAVRTRYERRPEPGGAAPPG